MSDRARTAPPRGDTPLPRPTAQSQPHWDGCRDGLLRVQRCGACGTHVFIPQPACTSCFSPALEWVTVPARGRVYSFTIVHRPQRPQFEVPYVIAIVELDEGFHMLTNLIDVAPADVTIGMPVEAEFVARSDAITLPYFKPA